MTQRISLARAAATLALLVPLMGCQLVKKLTGRGGNDAGSQTAAPLGNTGGASPVIALPNPNVAPLPTTPPPVPPPATPDAPGAGDAGAVAVADAPAAADAPVVAVVDGGAVPTDLEGDRRRRRGIDNFCKENPGRVHPRTHVLCPM